MSSSFYHYLPVEAKLYKQSCAKILAPTDVINPTKNTLSNHPPFNPRSQIRKSRRSSTVDSTTHEIIIESLVTIPIPTILGGVSGICCCGAHCKGERSTYSRVIMRFCGLIASSADNIQADVSSILILRSKY